MKIALWVAGVAIFYGVLLFFLSRRHKKNLPAPDRATRRDAFDPETSARTKKRR